MSTMKALCNILDWKVLARAAIVFSLPAVLLGCVSNGVEKHRMARYSPEAGGRNPWVLDRPLESSGSEIPIVEEGPAVEPTEPVQTTRLLRRGDRVLVYLRAIPEPEDLKDVLDDAGKINLPHIGKVKIGGMTPSQAETLIEQRYIDGGIYNTITVIMVAQQDEFFVQGEVMRPGKYVLTGETTLVQALSEAGGRTDFASSKVTIRREDRILEYNLKDIEDGDQENPTVEPGDVIKVVRSGWLSL